MVARVIAHVYVPLWLGIGVPWVAVCLLPWPRRRRVGRHDGRDQG